MVVTLTTAVSAGLILRETIACSAVVTGGRTGRAPLFQHFPCNSVFGMHNRPDLQGSLLAV
jgi:hypothetical protein